MKRIIIIVLAMVMILAGCGTKAKESSGSGSGVASSGGVEASVVPRASEPVKESPVNPQGSDLRSRIKVPAGYTRIVENKGSFGDFLRNYKVLPDGSPVMLYNGMPRTSDPAVCVFDMHLGKKDLQQCADSIMRIYAEYLMSVGRESDIAFHLADGSVCDWISFKNSGGSFEGYLEKVFAYAGTYSMQTECRPTSLDKLKTGDVFIKGGSPGHVVMVADICENNGKKAFLLAQGYMPAQQFHILENRLHEGDPWYYEDEVVYPFVTPEYTFGEGSLMRPIYLD